jgi:CHAT domain-containing protein
LKPDEACIMYSLTAGHEIIILTVSKKYAQVLFHEDPRFIGDIKEKVWKTEPVNVPVRRDEASLNKFVITNLRTQTNIARDNYDKIAMAPKSDLDKAYRNLSNWMTNTYAIKEPAMVTKMEDFLKRFQKYLIVPVSNRLTGIKNLIIAPDDVFNFIPFEALKTFDGKYMVEKYNFRYIHSASVLMALQQRNYEASRKPLLAMGGAVYEKFDQQGMGIGSSSEMNLLEIEVAENVKSGKSLRRAYASIIGNGPLSPIPGTTEEVKNIAKNLSGSEIFFGNDMTENRLKEFSKNGQLKNYKVLHLATHGMVVPEIPDLSCLAMCIFKNEQNGEDGFLSAPEIAGLQLNADLTVLSACETAQGKFFAGEGVTGITQSLILAGSNAALVTLWKVDDTATMNFMSNFYKEVSKGKPYAQIVNDLKKKFIKGDFGKEFTHPNYWAPFVYYGK